MRPLSDSQREACKRAVAAYQDQLTPEVEAYLHDRGFTPPTVLSAQLGCVADPLPGHEHVKGMLAIPYLAARGPVTIKFRCPVKHDHAGHRKYMGGADEPSRLYYPPNNPPKNGQIHVCEGELDALTLAQVGLYAVGVPGAEVWKDHFTNQVHSARRVYVWGDPDAAGRKLTAAVCKSIRHAIPVPITGGDVNEVYQAQGAAALLALIEN
jgi:DNA primase